MPTCTQTKAKTHDNSDIIAFMDIVSASAPFAYRSKEEQGGCRHICVKTFSKDESGKKADKMRRLVFFHQKCIEMDERVGSVNFAQNHDYYISKNSFYADRRTKEALFSYDNIVIDLDIHDNNKSLKWYEENLDFLINKLIYTLHNDYKGKFPEFNVVRSGRGVQLWIGLDSFSARVEAFRRRYTAVCDYFCQFLAQVIEEDNDLKEFEVDHGASTDATRLARIPYTYNQHRYDARTHTGYQTRFEHLTDYRYDLDEIQDFILSPTKKPRKAKITQNGDFTALNIKRMRFIEYIVKHTYGDCEGRREVIAWLYYNALIQTTDQTAAEEMLYQLNESFQYPLGDTQIQAIIDEFERKSRNIGEINKDGYTETGYYTISSTKFLETLQATQEERLQYIGATSRELDRKAAREKKAERNRRITELRAAGKSIRAIAAEIGCSDKTVQTVLKNTAQGSNNKATSETDTVQTENKAVQAETTSTVQTAELPKRSRRKESTGSNGVRAVQPSRTTPPH